MPYTDVQKNIALTALGEVIQNAQAASHDVEVNTTASCQAAWVALQRASAQLLLAVLNTGAALED